jgi:DNA-binding LytR/AlgR family response regulator
VQRVIALRQGGGETRRSGGDLLKVPVSQDGETRLLDAEEVLYLEADGDHCWVHLPGERLASQRSMRELEDALPATVFFRIHRSYLVNLRRVVAIETVAPGRSGVRLGDGTVLEVARRQTRALKQHLGLR